MAGEGFITYNIKGEDLWLLPQRALYWPSRKTLLIADLHLGKSTYFRQHGLNVPVEVLQKDLDCLDEILLKVEVKKLILLGDLFHNTENSEWEIFGAWLKNKSFKIHLVLGNHDILKKECYARFGIKVYKRRLSEPPFIFSHKPFKEVKADQYVFSGHIHPGIGIHGVKARQSVRVPCFWFGKQQAVLPAFGNFTGSEYIQPLTGDKIFAIAGDEIFSLS